MLQPMIGFAQDEQGDWVAELGCGHRQHVRHKPPWTQRPWVVSDGGRAAMLGHPLDCKSCDREGPIAPFQDRLSAMYLRMARAARQAGRSPQAVRLLPISKTQPVKVVRLAIAAGLKRFGENKVQELCSKADGLGQPDIEWVLVGHLQSNKVRQVAEYCSEFQALDSLKLAQALDRRLQQIGRSLDVLVQVNTSGEASKYGVEPEQLPTFVKQLPAFSSLRVRGLMTLARFSADEALVRPCFSLLRGLQEQLRQAGPAGLLWDELSMGMSGDLEWAIAEGATTVRVGRSLFGPRGVPDSHFWP